MKSSVEIAGGFWFSLPAKENITQMLLSNKRKDAHKNGKKHCCHLGRLLQPDREADPPAFSIRLSKSTATPSTTPTRRDGRRGHRQVRRPLPRHERTSAAAADSVLLGAVGGPKWEGLPGEQRPKGSAPPPAPVWASTPTTACKDLAQLASRQPPQTGSWQRASTSSRA